MSKGKGFLILVLAFMILSTLTAVSADNHADEIINTTGSDETGIAQTTQNNDILTKKDNGSFAALQNKINEAGEGASVTLENDYFFDESTDDSEGITVSKTITINGNGHAIDGLSKSRILTATSQVTLKNIIFKNGYSTVKSPVYIENAANTTISHCTFTNNHLEKSGGYGGALTLYGGETQTIDSCTFASNSATRFGGAVCIVYIDQIRIGSCTFTDNAAETGASIHAEQSHVEVYSSRFKNSSGNYGGAVNFGLGTQKSIVTVSSFENCTASNSGGAIYERANDITVLGCNFTGCQASYGGAVDVSSNGCLIIGSAFRDCLADASGGAIYFGGQDLRVLDSRFNGCAADWGGALYLAANGADVVINGSEFVHCSAVKEGGAISMKSAGGYLSHSNFTACVADYGGAVYWDSADGNLIYCSFESCRATEDGVVYWKGQGGSLGHSRFTHCFAAGDGGAVRWSNVDGSVSHSQFNYCSAGGEGGAIIWYSGDGKLSYCNFTSCNADYGGAVYWSGYGGNAQYLSFDGCFANNASGAIMWTGNQGVVSNSLFNRCHVNYTGEYFYTPFGCGGAIVWDGAFGTLSLSSFSECTSSKFSGAVNWIGNMDGLVDRCNFTGCSAESCGAAFIENCRASNCIFTNCSCLNECGGIYLMNDATLTDSTFINCLSEIKGGAVFAFENNEISGCNFIGCIANDGAAIYWDENGGIIRNSNFTDCHSKFFAGAIDWRSSGGIIDGCNFNNCSAVHRAGAIYWYNADSSISNCRFIRCSSKDGGAVLSYRPEGALESCSFIECVAENNGGAVYRGAVRNCIFTNNRAQRGGATYNASAIGCTFTGNGAYAMYNGIADDRCIFKNNQNYNLTTVHIDLSIQDFKSTYNSGKCVDIELKENGVKVADADVIMKVYDRNNLITTYTSSIYNAKVMNLQPGVYDAVCNVRNRGYELDPVKITLTIAQAPVEITSPEVTTTYNVNKNVVITVRDANNNPMEGVDISVNLNGIKYLTTNENGQIELSTAKLTPKTYTASITYEGNALYAKTTAISKVIIKKATAKIAASNKAFKKKVKTKKYVATLKNNKNAALKNVRLTLKIKGKTYSAVTNSKGQATFKITKFTKKGKHKATITYAGDKYYNKLTKTVQITVK